MLYTANCYLGLRGVQAAAADERSAPAVSTSACHKQTLVREGHLIFHGRSCLEVTQCLWWHSIVIVNQT